MFISLLRLKWYRSDDESREGTNTGDPTVDFEQEASQTENKEEEEEKEEDEDQEEEEEEVFAAYRIGKLNRFGFGETGGGEVGVVDVVVGSGAMAMFEVMAIGGEILKIGTSVKRGKVVVFSYVQFFRTWNFYFFSFSFIGNAMQNLRQEHQWR